MRALYFTPGVANSALLKDISEPVANDRALKVRMRAIGVCGTDRELLSGKYGWAPRNQTQMILGHESLAEVISAPKNSGFAPGDLVCGIVRHPDPVPCPNCALGEWDMCSNGQYTEHGIKELDGFCSDVFTLDPDYAIRVDSSLGDLGVLTEPASVVAKAWEHIEAIGSRAHFKPHTIVVTGAGPIGLLAALMGVQRGLHVHLLDRVKSGPKVDAAVALGAEYHSDLSEIRPLANKIDIVVECTGSDQLVLEMMEMSGPNGIVCLTGVSSGGRSIKIDIGALDRAMVLENEVVFGSVNANRRHYEKAAVSLMRARPEWLAKLITRRIPLDRWAEAFAPADNQIKTILVP